MKKNKAREEINKIELVQQKYGILVINGEITKLPFSMEKCMQVIVN